jgi:Amt family ammonium transporter
MANDLSSKYIGAIFSFSLVILMQIGFILLEVGAVRKKSTINILIKNIAIICLGTAIYWMFGVGFSFGCNDNNVFIGTNDFFPENNEDRNIASQMGFALAATTIISGSVAERCELMPFFVISLVTTGFIYPVVSHWIWSDCGFLNMTNYENRIFGVGSLDVAGDGAVHCVGGIIALSYSYWLGPRTNRFYIEKGVMKQNPIRGQSNTFGTIGCLFLLVGWFGFNTNGMFTNPLFYALDDDVFAYALTRTVLITFLSAATGGISSFLYYYLLTNDKKYDLNSLNNGVLSGLVGITACCSVVNSSSSFIIGLISGVIYQLGSNCLIYFQIDDVVDAVPVHLFNGIWGLIAASFFAHPDYMTILYNSSEKGIFYGGNGILLGTSLIYLICLIVFSGIIVNAIIFMFYSYGLLRISSEEERTGIDISQSGHEAYEDDLERVLQNDYEIVRAPLYKRKNANKLQDEPVKLFSSHYIQDSLDAADKSDSEI